MTISCRFWTGWMKSQPACSPTAWQRSMILSTSSKPSGLVVCCRLNEYQWLPKRLKLNGAICLEPLSSEEVSQLSRKGWT